MGFTLFYPSYSFLVIYLGWVESETHQSNGSQRMACPVAGVFKIEK